MSLDGPQIFLGDCLVAEYDQFASSSLFVDGVSLQINYIVMYFNPLVGIQYIAYF